MLRAMFPDSFSHWKVKSRKNNAVLCYVKKLPQDTGGFCYPGKELGLFWSFQSPDSEFAYLPAIFPRDKNGQIRVLRLGLEVAPLIDYGRKKQWKGSSRIGFCDDTYSFRPQFTEAEAEVFVHVLKTVAIFDLGTEDFDDSIYSEKYNPSFLKRMYPFFLMAFWIGVAWFIWRIVHS